MVEGKRCQIRSHDTALAPLRKRQIDTQLKSSQGESGFTLITVKSHNIAHPNIYNLEMYLNDNRTYHTEYITSLRFIRDYMLIAILR